MLTKLTGEIMVSGGLVSLWLVLKYGKKICTMHREMVEHDGPTPHLYLSLYFIDGN